MKINITTKLRYDIEIDGLVFNDFKFIEEWENFCKFESVHHGKIIAAKLPNDAEAENQTAFSDLFDSIFSPSARFELPTKTDGKTIQYWMVMASPDIIHALKNSNQKT